MVRIARRLGLAALTGLALLGGRAPQAKAQWHPYALWSDPYGLHGAAAVIRAQGEATVRLQEALKLNIENRRKRVQLWLYERENIPTAEQLRQEYLRLQASHSQYDPPPNEIYSANALNHLLDHIQRTQSPGQQPAFSPPLKAEILARINVSTLKAGGNIGLLKDGKVPWPLLLNREVFTSQRQRVDQLVEQALKQAPQGKIEPSVVEDLIVQVNGLHRDLIGLAGKLGDGADWTSTMYVAARSFLNQFDDAVKALQNPDVAKYLTGKYVAKGKNVAELVNNMTELGLHFAPANPGDEAEYMALHRALAAYVGPLPANPAAQGGNR
jgi:hypothetical protein